jgi:hypothetical protein
LPILQNRQTNYLAPSPRGNYTDWASATCRRNLVPTFVDRGMSRGQRGGSPTVVKVSFLDPSRDFPFNYLHIFSHKGWVDPVPQNFAAKWNILLFCNLEDPNSYLGTVAGYLDAGSTWFSSLLQANSRTKLTMKPQRLFST